MTPPHLTVLAPQTTVATKKEIGQVLIWFGKIKKLHVVGKCVNRKGPRQNSKQKEKTGRCQPEKKVSIKKMRLA